MITLYIKDFLTSMIYWINYKKHLSNLNKVKNKLVYVIINIWVDIPQEMNVY